MQQFIYGRACKGCWLLASALTVQFSNLLGGYFCEAVSGLPDVGYLPTFDWRASRQWRSSPSLRSGAMASEVALPVQFSNFFGGYLSKRCRASPDEARHTKFASKKKLGKRSSPSLRSGAMASEVGAARFELTTLARGAPRDTVQMISLVLQKPTSPTNREALVWQDISAK